MTQNNKIIEQIPTDTGITEIKNNITEIKKSVHDLKTQIENFDKDKNTLAKELVEQRQREIEEKKLEIEKKKTETLELIKKTKELEELKASVTSQKELDNLEKELKAIEPNNLSFREKIKEGGSKTRERIKEHKNPILIATGIGAGILLIRRWLKKRKANKEGTDEKSEKKEKKSRWKKALLWAGIGTGGFLVWKNWDTIKGRFSGLFGPKSPEKPTIENTNTYEQLSEEIKAKYRATSDSVDQFASTNNGFSVDLDQEKKAAIIFGLDKATENLSDFSTNDTLDYMQDQTEDGIIDKISNRGKTKIYNCLNPILSSFESFKPFGAGFFADPASTFKEWLKQATPEERKKAITLFYKEYINIINYVEERKQLLAEKLAKEEVMGKDHLNDTPTEDQQEDIQEKIEDDDWKEKKLQPFFASHKLADLAELSIKYGIDATDISQETKEIKESIDNDHDEMIHKEEDGATALTRADDDFQDGKIDNDTKKELIDVCEDFLEDGFGENSRSFLGAYTHLITEIFTGNTEMANSFLEKTQNKELIQEIKTTLTMYIQKLKADTFSQEDLENLKQQLESYHKVKEQYELSINKIENMSKGLHFDAWKVINLPLNAMKDIGKAFGRGKTNSWRERIGYGLGGAYVTGQTLYISGRIANGVAGETIAGKVISIVGQSVGKLGIEIGKLPVTLVQKGLKLYTGRRFLTSAGWSKYLISEASHLDVIEKEALLKHAFLRGEISEKGVIRVVKKLEISGSNGNLQDIQGVLQKRGLRTSDEVKLFQKYRKNKNIAKLLFKETPNTNLSNIKKIKYTFYDKMLKSSVNFDLDALTRLKDIDIRIKGFATDTEKQIFQSMMSHVKNIDQAEDLVIMGIDAQYLKYFKPGSDQIISAEKFGKYLGKYGKKINAETMPKLLNFFKNAKVANKMTAANQETIVFNAIKNISKLEAKSFNINAIEELQLNTSRYQKIATKVKTGVDNMIKDLNTMLKNPKLKTFYNSIKSKITNLTHYKSTVTAESVQAANDAGWLDKVAGFGKLSDEGIQALKSLHALIQTDKTILEALSKASKLDDVKDILRQAGIAVDKIDDGVLMKIVSTKKIDKITSIINYGAEYAGIKTLKATLKNPALKSLGKWLGIVGVAVDVAFVGIDFVSDSKEAKTIQQHNMIRGKNKEKEAYFDVITGGIGAAGFAVGLFLTTNPVGRVCLGAGFAAMGVEALGDMYYGEIDKFQQNYKDFLSQSVPEIKQRLIYINSRQTKLDSSFQDLRSKITGNMKAEEKQKFSMKTSQDAVKALIYFEEMQKYPYAMADLNDPEIRNNPDLESLVKQQKDLHDKAVNTRYAYIKKTYIDGKTSLVTKEALDKRQGVQALEAILAESRICQAVQMDTTYPNKNNVKEYKNYKANALKNMNTQGFVTLENMYATNKLTFFKMIASIPYYQAMLSQNTEIQEYEKLTANLDFFQQYANYKLMDIDPATYPTVSINEQTIDYDQMTYLLSTWTIVVTKIQKEEVTSANIEYLTDADILEKYKVSTNLGQNVLYDIATMQLGYTGTNNLSELKTFFNEQERTIKGIYFDPKHQDRAINENNGSDNEFAKDKELNDPKKILLMREYIHDAAHTASTGKMIEMNYRLNREYVDQYVKIINQNLTYRLNPAMYKQKIFEYIQKNSNGQYIQLPPELIIMGVKTGIQNIGAFVYARDGTKFDSKTSKSGIKNTLIG